MNRSINAGLVEKFKTADSKAVLLDYDGTLIDYTTVPETAKLPEHLFDILIKLVDLPRAEVYIITGRSHQDIDKILDHLPVNIIAEHGAMIRENGVWTNQLNDNPSWKKTIIPILKQTTSACPKSFIEEKPFSLTWHYRNAESRSGFTHSRELISMLDKIIHTYNLKILDGNKIVEILNENVGKGKAVEKLFEQKKYDFILSIGDDATDEEMFEYFLHIPDAFTIKVGNGNTFAKYKLNSINDVVLLLKQLSQ